MIDHQTVEAELREISRFRAEGFRGDYLSGNGAEWRLSIFEKADTKITMLLKKYGRIVVDIADAIQNNMNCEENESDIGNAVHSVLRDIRKIGLEKMEYPLDLAD